MTTTKVTLVDQIYDRIKKDILQKVLEPGQKINIKELTRAYNVSDTPVKQALNRLMAENMVVNTPNKGTSVRAVTLEEMNDIFDMRLMMDLYFMKDILSTLSYNNALFEQIKDNLNQQKEFIAQTNSCVDNNKYYTLDSQFHQLYLTGSGNKKVIDTFKNLNPFMYSSYSYIQQSPTRDVECVEEHEKIVQAIEKQDINLLKTAIETHIENSRKAMQLIFRVNLII